MTRVIAQAGLALLRPLADLDVWTGELPPPYEALCERMRDCAGLLCLLTDRVDTGLLAAAGGNLRVISQMAVGYDNNDVAAATARRVPVGNTPGVLTDATADFAWALLVTTARRVLEGDRYVRGTVAHLGAHPAGWPRNQRSDARHRWFWAHRAGDGSPCARLQHARALPQS